MLDTKGRKFVQPLIGKVADFCIKKNFSANSVTIFALILGITAGVLVYFKLNILGVILLWISGLFDAVDGTIARKSGSSPFGTVMDIFFDRVVEISLIVALALNHESSLIYLLFLACSIILSMTIFLTTGLMSSKTSEKSFYYQTGLMERSEGFIMFSLMIIYLGYLSILTIIFTILILFTVYQRFIEAKRILS